MESKIEELEAEIKRLKSDRAYIIGCNDGFAAAIDDLDFPDTLQDTWTPVEVRSWLKSEAARRRFDPRAKAVAPV